MIYIISRGITLNKFCILEKMVFIFVIFCVFTLIFESRPSFADFNFDFIFCSFRDKVTTERAAISRIWTNFQPFVQLLPSVMVVESSCVNWNTFYLKMVFEVRRW